VHVVTIISFIPTHAHFKNTNSHQYLKHLKNTLKTCPPTCFGPYIYDHLQGAQEQYFMPLLSWIPWIYVRYVLVRYAAVCHCRV